MLIICNLEYKKIKNNLTPHLDYLIVIPLNLHSKRIYI